MTCRFDMDSLEHIGHQLEQVLHDIQNLEQTMAVSVEHTAADAVSAAWQQARDYEKSRILSLIEAQRTALSRGCISDLVLQTLTRMITDDSTRQQ